MNERGMSLVEVLVATAVLAVAIIISLTVYDAARKSFKKGENATEQQEAVRIAYDRLTADIRMLGFNANPDGSAVRPDEQLEVALDHAIIFRGDFDAEDPALRVDHETALSGGAFNVVSTGNDEVVGYVLARPDGTGPDTITFQADVDEEPRNGVVTNVTVNNVVLNPTTPPYTLYKISLNNDMGTCCSGAFIVRTPVVENVRNMSFQYYDGTGPAPIAAPGASEVATVKATRAGITKFNISLIGMTRDPDMNYNDTSDPASAKYRKFELRGDVIPRNMRMKGIQDLAADVTAPTKPATPTLIAGHCGALIVNWTPNSSADGVTQYRVNYGPAAGTISGTRSTVAPPYYLDGLTTGTTYYISIQAQDAAGNVSVKSNESNAAVANSNTPSAPTGASATTGQVNNVRLSWTAVTNNTASVPAADPLAPACRDLAGYRVYRGDTSGFTASTTSLVVNETVVHAPSNPPYIDAPTVNCHPYYYRLTAVDTCGTESAVTNAFAGQSTTSIPPAAPTNVQAFTLSPGHIRVNWSPVVKDEQNNDIVIRAYDVYRSQVMPKTDPPSNAVFGSTPVGSSSTNSYDDISMVAPSPSQCVYYMVRAHDECINYSADSNSAQATCQFSGTVAINPPTDGATIAGVTPTTVTVTGGTDTYTGVTITYSHVVAGVTRTYNSTTTGTTWTDTGWLATPPGTYTITATVTNSTGCSFTTSITVRAGSAVGCCLSMFPTTNTIASCASGSAKCKEVSYKLGNDRCLTAVSVTSMTISWTDYTGNQPRWQTAQFNGTNIAAPGTWTTTYVGTPNEVGTATKSNFSAPAPTVNYASPMTAGNTTNVTYVFSKLMDSGSGASRVVNVIGTTQYVFTLLDSAGNPSGITTTCAMPSLTVN
ncbi:MAG TPA: prepilin-type N-terminal cleavage/methylation domain-containing protein [Candidatus Polarisedimenticolaceae bacterium]|nr:prepilin-type N-terminal cleavage/methylation domain-containing protein [Candidatus Polarisedimenticolaceae bacterium]